MTSRAILEITFAIVLSVLFSVAFGKSVGMLGTFIISFLIGYNSRRVINALIGPVEEKNETSS